MKSTADGIGKGVGDGKRTARCVLNVDRTAPHTPGLNGGVIFMLTCVFAHSDVCVRTEQLPEQQDTLSLIGRWQDPIQLYAC